jgi:hypothetical protein
MQAAAPGRGAGDAAKQKENAMRIGMVGIGWNGHCPAGGDRRVDSTSPIRRVIRSR